LKRLIENHYNYTGSQTAENILKNWEENLTHFTKVMPNDYKRILDELKLKKGLAING